MTGAQNMWKKRGKKTGGRMMKKTFLLIVICGVLACLTGCGGRMPTMAVDGTPWSKDWITLGQALGVEEPGHGLTLRDDKAAKDMCYTAWSIGEAQPYVNALGEETNLYDAQLVLLLKASGTAEEAQMNVDEWLDLAAEHYIITDTAQQTFNGQEFTVLTYTFASDTSPFARGVSAFSTFDTWAISVEFACQDTFEGDAGEIMADFLDHCHYAAE